MPRSGQPLGPCRPRAAARPSVSPRRRSPSRPTPGRSSRPRTSGCSARPSSTPRSSRRARRTTRRSCGLGGGDRRRRDCRGTARASTRAGRSRPCDGVLPDDAILTTDAGNFAGWAGRGFRFRRPGTFLGPTSGAMGYGLPAAIAAALVHRDRPGRGARRRRRPGDDDGRARDRGSRGRPRRRRSSSTTSATGRSGCGRTGAGRASGVATELGPIDFAAVARPRARGVRVERDADFEPALRAGSGRRSADGHPAGARRPGCRSTDPG